MESPLYLALQEFTVKAQADKTVVKMLKDWDRMIHIEATDGDSFTISVADRRVTVLEGLHAERDIALVAPSVTLIGVFTGALNPAREFAAGQLKFVGSNKDEMKLDAIVQLIWG